MKKQQIKAFTLVELIIVITILAILATIGFISYQSYTLDARDGKRVSDLGQIRKGLEIYQTKNSQLPTPDAQITNIVNGTRVLEYQGYAGTNVLNKIRADQVKDPKDNTQYTYSTNGDYTKYQLLSMLENGSIVNLSQTPINTTYAAIDYTTRKTYVVGNKLGIFLNTTTNSPIQESLSGNIDLGGSYSGTNFKVVFANTSTNSGVITGSGVSLYNNIITIANTVATTPAPVAYNWYLSGSSWIFKDSNNLVTYPTSCNNLLTNSGTFYITGSLTANGAGFKDGIYSIDSDGVGGNLPFDVYCDMNTDGGGWTLSMGINTSDSNVVHYENTNFWTSNTYDIGNIITPFSTDYKNSKIFSLYSGSKILIKISNTSNTILDWKSYNLNGTNTLSSFFNGGTNVRLTNGIINKSSLNNITVKEPTIAQNSDLYLNTNRGASPDLDRVSIGGVIVDDNGGGLGTWYDYSTGYQRPRADRQLLTCAWSGACRIGSDYDSANAYAPRNGQSPYSYNYQFYLK